MVWQRWGEGETPAAAICLQQTTFSPITRLIIKVWNKKKKTKGKKKQHTHGRDFFGAVGDCIHPDSLTPPTFFWSSLTRRTKENESPLDGTHKGKKAFVFLLLSLLFHLCHCGQFSRDQNRGVGRPLHLTSSLWCWWIKGGKKKEVQKRNESWGRKLLIFPKRAFFLNVHLCCYGLRTIPVEFLLRTRNDYSLRDSSVLIVIFSCREIILGH